MQNVLTVIGRAGSTPVLHKTSNDKEVVKFSLAQNENLSDGKQRTTWFEVEAWSENRENALKLIGKGREIVVTGRLVIDRYVNRDGKENVKAIIKMTSFHLCGPRPVEPEIEALDQAANS